MSLLYQSPNSQPLGVNTAKLHWSENSKSDLLCLLSTVYKHMQTKKIYLKIAYFQPNGISIFKYQAIAAFEIDKNLICLLYTTSLFTVTASTNLNLLVFTQKKSYLFFEGELYQTVHLSWRTNKHLIVIIQ